MMKRENIVVNWHLLEPCQLKCKYCYAEWDKAQLPLVFRSQPESEKLIDEIASLKRVYENVRLSFAGGEPLLNKRLTHKIAYAHQQGLKISIITNGDLLTEEFLDDNSDKIDVLGVSIDSVSHSTNIRIGRATLMGRVPNYDNIVELIQLARKNNPSIKIKINTVVNKFNFNEDMNAFISSIQPNKWKILRVLPATDKALQQQISDEQFNTFVNMHKQNKCNAVEDNNQMLNSYIMIDPYGRFFCNRDGLGYDYSPAICEVGVDKALKSIKFEYEKFTARY
ncbi:MAG: radical SAM protein [Gammaproteobacteria bacterium]|nr:radical SAM protein [Gammaproteobacteria bacterium]